MCSLKGLTMKKIKFVYVIVITLLLFNCNTDKAKKEDLKAKASNSTFETSEHKVIIKANELKQTIRGFGGANISANTDDLTSYERKKTFSVRDGMGLSVLRVQISPDSSKWLANKETIDAAKEYGAMVIASAWTAPASMKTNASLVGGKLKKSSYEAYAEHLSDFNSRVGGVDAISPVNQPNRKVTTNSMNLTAEDVADFVAAEGKNIGTKIMAPETYNMDQIFIKKYLSNPKAKANTDIIAGHISGSHLYDYNFDKEVWITEGETDIEDGDIWSNALNTAEEIHNSMDVGYSLYNWSFIKGYNGFLRDNALVTKRGYAMTHFSKWIRPGFTKVKCTSNPTSGVYTSAYKKDETLVIVIINRNSKPIYQWFSFEGIAITRLARFQTTSTDNLVKKETIFFEGKNFSINLPAHSITTLDSF